MLRRTVLGGFAAGVMHPAVVKAQSIGGSVGGSEIRRGVGSGGGHASPATTGGVFWDGPISRTAAPAGGNSIFLTKLVAQQNSTATAVLLDSSVASSLNIKAVIYDAAHSALLASSGIFSSVALDYNRFVLTSPLSLTAGTTYYVGFAASAAFKTTIQLAGGPGSWWANGGQSVASPANPLSSGASSTNSLMVSLELSNGALAGKGFSPDQASGVTLSASNSVATFPAVANKGARSIVVLKIADAANPT